MRSRIFRRLLAWFLLAALVPTLGAGLLAYRFVADRIDDAITESLNTAAGDRAKRIEGYFRERQRDARVMALDPTVADAVVELRTAFHEHGSESPEYQQVDARYREFLAHLAETFGYHDLFLVEPGGTIVFSVAREADFGTSLGTGEYRHSQLARVFERTCTLLDTEVSEFEFYEPSGEPAAFLAAPVFGAGELQGALALQLDTASITDLAMNFASLGETGETILASESGERITFLTPTRHDASAAFVRAVPASSDHPVQQALAGKRGDGIYVDYRGEEVLAAWRYLPQMRWAMVVKIDTEEAFAPVRTLSRWGGLFGLAVVTALVLMALVVARSFSRPIAALSESTAQLGSGDLTARAPEGSSDEIGALARAFNRMAASLQGMAQVASEIAAGNLDLTMEEKGDKDTLARAVNQMVARLRELTEDNRRQLSHATAQSEFKDILRHNARIETMAQEATSFLCARTSARVGAMYVVADDRVDLIGAHAYAREGEAARGFALNEGLVGQVAREGREVVVEALPGDQLRLASGLVDAPAATVAVLPFRFGGQVLGVVELGFFDEPSADDLALLRDAMESVGIAVNAHQNRAELERMLRKTEEGAQALEAANEELQAQQEELKSTNEELQVQEEELRQTNEELEEKAEELGVQGEELRQANEELEEKARLLEEQQRSIRAQNTKIETARRELEVRAEQLALTSRYKSEFLANMSHELRTPLNSMLILSSLLADNADGNLTGKQVEYAETVQSSGADLLVLINEILDLAKIESGTMDLEIVGVDLGVLAQQMERSFEPVAEQGEVSLAVELADGLPGEIRTDERRLKQVLKNLLSNAFKFTRRGSVTLSVAPDGPDGVTFAVADTGIGIPPQEQQVIFEAFQQVDGSTSRRYGGTGLGLSISREIVNLLGGELTVSSVPEEGSTFTLRLPVASSPETEETLEAAAGFVEDGDTGEESLSLSLEIPPAEALVPFIDDDRDAIEPGQRTVLLIEDDEGFACGLRDLARERGFRCIAAGDGESGLSLAFHHRPDAIILDIGLPGMDGYAVLERLKDDPRTRPVPVHVVSAAVDEKRAIYGGAVAAMEKPVDRGQLDAALSELEAFIERSDRRLLLVEDDAIERRALSELLAAEDVRITEAETGAEALELLQTHRFDCMVLDLGLPGVSGFEVLQEMEAQGLDNLPVVVYTGRELTRKETTLLGRRTRAIVVKDVRSPDRLLQETALFLHRVNEELPRGRPRTTRKTLGDETDLQGKRLLVVDDDLRNIFALTSVLEARGAEVAFAENGRDGLAKLTGEEGFDAVLMDIMMPEMDGYEAMRAIREIPRLEELPVIALTAKAMRGDRQRCLDAGASDYISKPVDVSQLLSLLRVWLHER